MRIRGRAESASGDEVCVCVTTDALRKLRFSPNFSGRKRASGSRWLRARWARADYRCGQLCNSASGRHVLVKRCVCCLPDREFALSTPYRRA